MSNASQVVHPSSKQYFASLPTDELLPHLLSKIEDYYAFALKYRFLDKWKRSYMAYYGMSQSGTDTSKLSQAGTNGEEYILKVNDYRSLLQNLLTMTTSQRPALQPKAMNTDSQSMNQTILARTVLDYYMTEKHLEATLKDAAEFALFGAEGFVRLDWNATAGDLVTTDPDSGAPIYDGDLEFKAFHPIDIVRECWGENATGKWKIVREFMNKWDIAAKHPDLWSQIVGISEASDMLHRYSNINYNAQTSEDFIPVWTFYHEKTEAVPNGRMVKFCGADVVLSDGALPFKKVPVYPISPAPWHGTPFGYTVAYDLLGIQNNLDALNSIVATNQMNYGIQNILLPRGAEYNVVALAQGLNGIDYDPKVGEPKPLNLLQTPKEIIENMSRLEAKQETLSGVNSVARGNVDRDMSGAALALIASQAVQFNAGLQQSYNFLLESVGTGVIEILQEYATTPRIASIAGKSNRARIKEFKGSDLDGISRVAVEQVNPVSKTAAGRLQMAQDWLKMGLVKTPQQYIEVLTTGNLETQYEHEASQMLYVRSENEDLSDQKPVQAVLTDLHALHIQEHATVLNSPEARSNPAIVQSVTQHIQQHIDILKDPAVADILRTLGQNPIAPPQPAAPPPGGVPSGPPKPQGPGGPQALNPTPPVVQAANQVKEAQMPGMPNMPKGAPVDAQNAYQQLKTNAA
jgi:hypothetical protein